uniref:PiggyBac transposable element-derived protein domain-containing protein n=1 Tax=Clastoptera arizonana TaxID=38151 RepID=A0A1B6CKQ2_9HEMI
MILWHGRLYFRQYIKGKRHKYGLKLYSLCDPHGLILKFFLYWGVLEDFGGKGLVANVVLKLMLDKLNVGHSLFMDNYYNSFPLETALLRLGTYCTGTLRMDRKYISPEVKSAKLKKGKQSVGMPKMSCAENGRTSGLYRTNVGLLSS